jgi:hypothetical protein
MASITCCGVCDVAALSKYTKGLPFTLRESIGKSFRMVSTLTMADSLAPIEAFVGAPHRERLPKAGLASNKKSYKSNPIFTPN